MSTPNKAYSYALAGLVALFIINWLVHLVTGFAPAYCWGQHLAGPFYNTWAQPLFTVLAIGFVVCLFMGRYGMAIKLVILMVLVTSLPQFVATLFGLGSTCYA
jgi:hypothetical protein